MPVAAAEDPGDLGGRRAVLGVLGEAPGDQPADVRGQAGDLRQRIGGS